MNEFSSKIKDLMEIVKRAALTNSSVLITGEFGVQTDFFAEKIHLNSNRAIFPFKKVNCFEKNENLFDSEFLRSANGGTIFLNEVSALSLEMQKKVLFFINNKQEFDVRIICSTSKNLAECVLKKEFLEDLYFPLSVLVVQVPPLREHREDIICLAEKFLQQSSLETGKKHTGFSDEAKKCLFDYNWPCNELELKNIVERACIDSDDLVVQSSAIYLRNVQDGSFDFENSDKSLKTAQDKFKAVYVAKILEECFWNQTKASKVLGIQRTYLSRLINELGIRENKK